ncbi:hypothetical protein NDU88_005155 [Pleurodeles waltl]|uniref:Uncharacterized protein n=1 Tax=Pleurodeles waltl TaxID=8319 RepID=A0AAV7TUM5_PLEWA|nr:hypothetical protein NDU88_005155 [Pleurodeles waltl]
MAQRTTLNKASGRKTGMVFFRVNEFAFWPLLPATLIMRTYVAQRVLPVAIVHEEACALRQVYGASALACVGARYHWLVPRLYMPSRQALLPAESDTGTVYVIADTLSRLVPEGGTEQDDDPNTGDLTEFECEVDYNVISEERWKEVVKNNKAPQKVMFLFVQAGTIKIKVG